MYKAAIFCLPLLLFLSCAGNEAGPQKFTSKYDYLIDTVTITYPFAFSGKWVGGQDIFTQKGTTQMLYNFCESARFVIKDMERDSVLVLNAPYASCEQIHAQLQRDRLLVLFGAGQLFTLPVNNKPGALLADLSGELSRSGMIPERAKPGGDQKNDVPENVFYFRVNQDFGRTDGRYSKYMFAFPISAKLNLETGRIAFFGKAPKFTVDREYGLLSSVYDLYTGDTIMYTNAINGRIEIVNTLNGKTKVLDVPSRYQLRPVPKFVHSFSETNARQLKFDHSLFNAKYEPLFYNPNDGRYYRLFHPELQEYNDKGLLNTEDDKLTVLMVFDQNLRLEDEVLLPVRGNQFVKLYAFEKGVGISIQDSHRVANGASQFSLLRIRRK